MSQTPSTNPNQIIDALNWRYATKSFDGAKKLTTEQLNFVVDSMRLAPSSYGIQAWKFVDVSTPAIREELRKIGWDQAQFTDASHLFAFCSYIDPVSKAEEIVEKFVDDIVLQRGVTAESLEGYKNMMIGAMKTGNTTGLAEYTPHWLDNQLYIALGQTMAACAAVGIDTCPIEGFDIEKANQILGLDQLGLKVKSFLAVGFRDESDKYATTKKVRFSKDQVLIKI